MILKHIAEYGYCRVHLLRLRAFMNNIFIDASAFVSAPGPRRRSRGWPWRLELALVPDLPGVHVSVSQVPFFPIQAQSRELLAKTEGESTRSGSPQGHKAGPLVVLFAFQCCTPCVRNVDTVTTIGEADASIRVPEFLCVSAVLEMGGLLPDGFLSFSPDFFECLRVIWIHGLVFILRTYGWFSCLGQSTSATSALCSYGVKLRTFDLFLPSVVAREIQTSKTQTPFSSRNPIHSFVCLCSMPLCPSSESKMFR